MGWEYLLIFAIDLILSCIYEINKKFKKAYGTMDYSVDRGGYGHCRDCFRESVTGTGLFAIYMKLL